YRKVSFLRNPTKTAFHAARSPSATSRKVRYFSNRGRRRGKTQLMHGDIRLATQSANSSSWGEPKFHSTLSIGRCFGRKSAIRRDVSASVERNVWGKHTWYVLGNANRRSMHSRLWRCVVPLRQCPSTNSGAGTSVFRTFAPKRCSSRLRSR